MQPTADHWRRDWRPPRPLIFGEFCDSDDLRHYPAILQRYGGRRPWWLTEGLPVHTWRPEAQAQIEFAQRLKRLGIDIQSGETSALQTLVEIVRRQSLMVRKTTLEMVRRRANVQGYVIIGLRDTPIATSGIFDDLGQAKWTADEFLPFNAQAILCLDGERRRRPPRRARSALLPGRRADSSACGSQCRLATGRARCNGLAHAG